MDEARDTPLRQHLCTAHGMHRSRALLLLDLNTAESLWLYIEIPITLKGLDMTPQFLREEAMRFRGMAVTVDREASKLRLLTMANDYESRAKVADELTEPNLGEVIKGNTGGRIVKELNEAG